MIIEKLPNTLIHYYKMSRYYQDKYGAVLYCNGCNLVNLDNSRGQAGAGGGAAPAQSVVCRHAHAAISYITTLTGQLIRWKHRFVFY
jgi:hypothetical protein